MSILEIKDYAKTLHLPFISSNIVDELDKCVKLSQSSEEFLQNLLRNEVLLRNENSKLKRIKNAGFPYKKYLDDLVLDLLPTDAKTRLYELKTLDFIRKGRNVVEYGNPGTGKTHLAIALGIEAANSGFSVKYFSVPCSHVDKQIERA